LHSILLHSHFPIPIIPRSYLNAIVLSLGGMASSYGGGRWADEWEARGNPRARLQVVVVSRARAGRPSAQRPPDERERAV